jgi:hypothetical protein
MCGAEEIEGDRRSETLRVFGEVCDIIWDCPTEYDIVRREGIDLYPSYGTAISVRGTGSPRC